MVHALILINLLCSWYLCAHDVGFLHVLIPTTCQAVYPAKEAVERPRREAEERKTQGPQAAAGAAENTTQEVCESKHKW